MSNTRDLEIQNGAATAVEFEVVIFELDSNSDLFGSIALRVAKKSLIDETNFRYVWSLFLNIYMFGNCF